jgi:methylenetetrahydrofolate--tRNA-(uracil-5-)-methyltransferase
MTKDEFYSFYQVLTTAEVVPLKEFEKEIYFEGCLPIEVLAKRGEKTLTFGPLKPVGLIDPRTNERPYAVVQLRQDNSAGTLYNLVGFQTHLKWEDQKRVIQSIPGLEEASIVRYGVMHRNTFINSPNVLFPTYQFKKREDLFFAGQITGVEDYVESAASGLLAGMNAARYIKNEMLVTPPATTSIGSLAHYITSADPKYFQPMNANFGLFSPLPEKVSSKKERAEKLAERAIENIQNFKTKIPCEA